MTHLNRAFDAAQRGMGSLIGGTAKFAAKLGAVGLAMAGVASAGQALHTIGNFLKQSSEAASNFEQLTVQFEVLTKSASTTADLLKQMREEAQKSPLTTSDYAQAAKTFMAFGGEVKDVMPTLKMLGDVSMGNADRFASLALAFSQTQAAGRLMGQEVLQFVNAGFNPLQVIAEKTGKSMGELKKAMEDGKISFELVRKSFQAATSDGGLFFNAIQRGAETTAGKLAQFTDSIDLLKIAFGEGLNVGVKAFAEAGSEMAASMQKSFSTAGFVLGDAIRRAVDGDLETFKEIGMVIGRALAEGVKAMFEIAVFEIKEMLMKPVQFVADKLGLGNASEADLRRNQDLRRSAAYGRAVGGAVDAISATASERLGPTILARELYNQGVRGNDLGYQGTEMGKMLIELQKLNDKLAPIKF